MENHVQIKDKFCLTIDEAAEYFNIGEKKLAANRHRKLALGFYHSKRCKISDKTETL